MTRQHLGHLRAAALRAISGCVDAIGLALLAALTGGLVWSVSGKKATP